MKTDITILVPIVVIVGCIILIIIQSTGNEHFMGEQRESDIILPNPVPTFISNIEDKKEIIINNQDKNNKYPSEKYELKIDPPQVNLSPPKPGQAFHDANFIRDNGVNDAMKKDSKNDKEDYKQVVNSYLEFKKPENSQNLLSSIDIKDISKEELDNSYISDIYKKMSVKIINNISKEQINNITGKPISDNKLTNLYKPVLSLIDENLTYNNLEDIEYKYKAYNELPMGSLL